MKKVFLYIFVSLIGYSNIISQLITETKQPNSFSLSNAVIYVDPNDFPLVKRSAELLQQDIEMVTGKKLEIVKKILVLTDNIIVIGSVEKSFAIKDLIKQKKVTVASIINKWEAYKIQSLKTPFEGYKNGLIIMGSDRRGTAYGVFEFSKQIGVSPWYWWADVPVQKRSEIFIKQSIIVTDSPKVKYRGIFINDEAPAFSGWTKEKFGGVNHLVYEKIFELILRLKGNYLWPAMWGNAFNDDDTLNPILADKYGIVMGTSHHEPMLRAQQEWKRYGKGKWDYDSNEVVLREFWRKGIQNMGSRESILTIGMRGDGDMPMSRETATSLLERIVKDQRQIIEEVTKKPASETPQLWALYKEVQDYYDKGMRVPDDVTLLLCDDNWGNIRKLPKLNEKPRKGGYGIYYHFDYVGGPRNYKWLNTNPIPRIWEQMHLAYEHGVKQIWIVNVGDIKPMEFPISFWLDYAWNPEKIGADDLKNYTEKWAASQFGNKYAKEIAEIISKYSKYNGRRKPELLDHNTYSLDNYGEFFNVVFSEYNLLSLEAEDLNKKIPLEFRDAYYQLVLYPVAACANLNELYYNVAMNKDLYYKKDVRANIYADRAKELYYRDSMLALIYNNEIANGKWNHMMDQTHIGYTYWQQPPRQKMPDVNYVSADSAVKGQAATFLDEMVMKSPGGVKGNTFYEREYNGVSIEASHFTKAINTNSIKWKILPDLGRIGDAITTFPVTAPIQKITSISAHLEYEVYTYSKDSLRINAYFSPTLNYYNTDEGLQYAISIDDEAPQMISINKEDRNTGAGIWNKWVGENIIIKTSRHKISRSGKHIVKYWMVNPGVVLQKLVLDFGGVKPSYLGPPETRTIK
ncbi:MAG TPA: glycosyl hydrolase 115 family protein [Chitinophagaceae bacterium]|nr:glycosyl hydrolase 115 family protein [Chitinophagaceae bacterium]